MQYSEYTFNWVGWCVKWWCLVFVALPCQVCEWKSRWNSTDLEAPPAAAVEVHPAEHVCHYSRVSLCSCEPARTKVGLILVKMPSWFWFCNSTEWARFSFGIKKCPICWTKRKRLLPKLLGGAVRACPSKPGADGSWGNSFLKYLFVQLSACIGSVICLESKSPTKVFFMYIIIHTTERTCLLRGNTDWCIFFVITGLFYE